MRLKNIWGILLVFLMLRLCAHAGESRTEFIVDFRVNVVCIDPGFSDNASRISDIVSHLRELENDSAVEIVSVAFCGAASPEGSAEWNRYLASARRAELERLIRNEVALPDSIVSRDDSYIPWGYLRGRVAASDCAYRDTVVAIIDGPSCQVKDPDSGKLVDSRISQLKLIDNRRVWDDLFRRYFSKMRNASAVIITYRDEPRPSMARCRKVAVDAVAACPLDTLSNCHSLSIADSRIASPGKPFYMGVYSNMLYDVLATPNIGAEFYLGRNFTIGGNWMHAWWSYDRRHRYWRIYGGELHVRRWFGEEARRKPLTGHHIGLYAQALTYDFEFGGKAHMGGKPGGTIFDRAHIGGGVEYGYSLPIDRRLNIDFSIGIGYIGGRVYEFVPEGDRYLWTATRHYNWVGPTKIEVSLVWLIGRGNINRGKGGAR